MRLRVEIIVHEGERRSVALLGLKAFPEGIVMSLTDYERLKPMLTAKFGALEEIEVEASPELLAIVDGVRREFDAAAREDDGNGNGNK